MALGVLFLAVQFVDLLTNLLVAVGIEKIEFVPHHLATGAVKLVHMPYSHCLAANVAWAIIAYLFFRLLIFKNTEGRNRLALIIAIAVLSHWFLDLIVHTQDLPLLTGDSLKVGFGLWDQSLLLSVILEAAFLIVGLTMYIKSTKSSSVFGNFGMVLYVCTLVFFSFYALFSTPPPPTQNVTEYVLSLTLLFLGFAGIAFWLDKKRG